MHACKSMASPPLCRSVTMSSEQKKAVSSLSIGNQLKGHTKLSRIPAWLKGTLRSWYTSAVANMASCCSTVTGNSMKWYRFRSSSRGLQCTRPGKSVLLPSLADMYSWMEHTKPLAKRISQ